MKQDPSLLERYVDPMADRWNPNAVDPALMTLSEYLHLVDPSGERHDGDAYKSDIESFYYHKKSNFTLVRQTTIRGVRFDFMVHRREITYPKQHPQWKRGGTEPYKRDENGQIAYWTREEGDLLGWRSYDYSIGVWTPREGDKCIAATQDEWGCMLVRVADSYRGFGLGPMLVKLARTLEPDKPSGGFTYSGHANFTKVHREFVRQALTSGKYSSAVRAGKMTMERVREIVNSAKLNIRPQQKSDISSNDSSNWVCYADGHGSFIIYDRKLPKMLNDSIPEHFLYDMIKGYIYVRPDEDDKGRVKKITACDIRIKTMLFAMANQFCETHDCVLYVEPDDMDIKGFEFGPQSTAAGYMSAPVLSGHQIDGSALGRSEARWRKTFDHHNEFAYALHEMAEVKAQ